MGLIELKTDFTDRQLRQFAGIWLPAFALTVGFMLWNKFGFRDAAFVLWAVTAVIGTVGVLKPRWIKPLLVAWLVAAFPIGWTVSHLLLALIYYACISPLGLLMRLLGRDPLKRQDNRSVDTYWVARKPVSDRNRYFRQF